MFEADVPLTIRLTGSEDQRKLFLTLLPILKNAETIGQTIIGEVDFEKAAFFAHCKKQYGTLTKNNDINKSIASQKIAELRGKGMAFEKIAEWLNSHGYKTSRNKLFKRMTVKRLFDESNKKQ